MVYLAYHLRLKKYIVLKRLKNVCADVSMLRNEVDVLKGLRHRYLPQVYDFISFEGDLYTVIDYINGYDLAYYFDNGYRFSEQQIVYWMKQLCDVLDYLHSNNILHTDIKPANIIITESGDVCLIDFGISLMSGDTIKGLSKNFSSPEQYSNYMYLEFGTGSYRQLSCATDIYSLAATFYYILTGDKPDVRSFRQLVIPENNSCCSDALAKIINKAVEYRPENRFKSASQMLKALENIKKQSAEYRKLFLVQLLASLLSAVMIVGGIFTMNIGFRSDLVAAYEREYASFVSECKSGNTSESIRIGLSIINNPSYSSEINGAKKSEILHMIGNCYLDEENYPNASRYFSLAIDCAEPDKIAVYCRDLAISLAGEGKTAEAKQTLEKARQNLASDYTIELIEAGIDYSLGKYSNVRDTLRSVIERMPQSCEDRYSAYILLGDSLMELEDYRGAYVAFNNAVIIEKSAASLRRQGSAALAAAFKESDMDLCGEAFSTFKTLCSDYSATTDDIINLAQACVKLRRVSSYEECKKMLVDYCRNKEDFRVYVMLIRLAAQTNDVNIGEYLTTAHRIYDGLSEKEKALVDEKAMSEVKYYYRICFEKDW